MSDLLVKVGPICVSVGSPSYRISLHFHYFAAGVIDRFISSLRKMLVFTYEKCLYFFLDELNRAHHTLVKENFICLFRIINKEASLFGIGRGYNTLAVSPKREVILST